eukprot:6253383-Pyramimonas_sp.AAC.1
MRERPTEAPGLNRAPALRKDILSCWILLLGAPAMEHPRRAFAGADRRALPSQPFERQKPVSFDHSVAYAR